MSRHTRVAHPMYNLLPTELEGFDSLAELALDLRWSWNHCDRRGLAAARSRAVGAHAQPVGRAADGLARPAEQLAGRPGVPRAGGRACCAAGARTAAPRRWFQQEPPRRAADLRRLFQHGVHAERGAAHLLGRAGQRGRRPAQGGQRPGRAGGRRGAALPAGLFPPGDRQGRGASRRSIPYNDPGQLPITPVARAERRMAAAGDRAAGLLGLAARLAGPGRPGRSSTCSTATTPANYPGHRGITSELYGGGPELRLKQELVLGIGGWRLLRALGHRARRSAT